MRCSSDILFSFVDIDIGVDADDADDEVLHNSKIINITPHPPNDEGNLLAISNLWNMRRNTTSNKHQIPTDNTDFWSEDKVNDDDADGAVVVEASSCDCDCDDE